MTQGGNLNQIRMARVAGHFGEWLQGRLGPDGPIALVSVQCSEFWVQASNFPAGNTSRLLSDEQISDLSQYLDHTPLNGVNIHTNMIARAGLGASTAALLAAAKVIAPNAPTQTLMRACLAVEGATDPLGFDAFDQLIWASRTAEIIARAAPPPRFQVVGGLWGEGQITDPQDTHFADISDLIADWQDATQMQDRDACAKITTRSATLCSEFRGPLDDPSLQIAKDINALGVIRAHTGSARGFLFEPGNAPSSALPLLQEAGYSNTLTFETGGET